MARRLLIKQLEDFMNNTDFGFSETPLSSGAILREVGRSVKDLLHSEVNLVTLELKESGEKATRDLIRAISFGSLLALSTIPFLGKSEKDNNKT